MPMEQTYLVFQQDGAYVFYRQFELLEEGAYTLADDGVYLLRSGGESGRLALFDRADLVQLYVEQSGVTRFNRMEDVPMFVNLPGYGDAPQTQDD